MKYNPVRSLKDIDIYRHAVMEASAGTGKTYTIENLVIRFLIERSDIGLENILLVTFTEKATSEMKIRIRRKLEKELNTLSGQSGEKLKAALDTFDTASIFTIHGFCQSLLRDFAFENGALFQWEVTDDSAIKERLLREQIRKTWPGQFGESLRDILEISGFSREKEGFIKKILNLSGMYNEAAGDKLNPDARQIPVEELRKRIIRMRQAVSELRAFLSPEGKLCEGFEDLNVNSRTKTAIRDNILTPLGDFLAEAHPDQFSFSDLFERMDYLYKKGEEYLSLKFLKAGENLEVCPDWEPFGNLMVSLLRLHGQTADVLVAQSILWLQEDLAGEKKRQGLISYDDMLSHVNSALQSEDGKALLRGIREKYKVAFVDEFQDTDPVQWKIFKKIFLDDSPKSGSGILFLIGDPKQAIYSFRGADVHAYLTARNEMERLAEQDKAACYSLSTNWRSTPELIDRYNALFPSDSWFEASGPDKAFDIGYHPVNPPPPDERIFSLVSDNTQRKALSVVDLSQASSLRLAKSLYARFIAREIDGLMQRGGLRYLNIRENQEKPLTLGDICVLVRTRNEAPILEEEFKKQGIAYSYYKKPGLFFSDEAVYLSFLLRAVIDPGDLSVLNKALLTPFFNFLPQQLLFTENIPASHPVKQLLFKLNELGRLKKWGPFFQCIMEETGLILREADSSDWERKYSNYRQLFTHLHEMAYTKNLDLRGVGALLEAYRKQIIPPGEDADVHQIETEATKVKIMTMHVAKGLEFPVVFIFGGLTQVGDHLSNCHVFHQMRREPPEAVKTLDLTKSLNPERHQEENLQEEKRLYYVCLTRARFKLYVPYYPCKHKSVYVGPVSRLLTPSLDRAFSQKEGHADQVSWIEAADTNQDRQSANGDEQPASDGQMVRGRPLASIIPENLFPEQNSYTHRKIDLASFSSLHNKTTQDVTALSEPMAGFSTLSEKAREDDEVHFPLSAIWPGKELSSDRIPGGTEVGSMFHDILENISFETVRNTPPEPYDREHFLLGNNSIRELILSLMSQYQVNPIWLSPVCEIIYNALTAPITDLSDTFSLADLTRSERLHEVEFYFPFPLHCPERVAECQIKDGFIRGYVDLIFLHRQKYYIADWKSNILEDGYGRKSLEESMTKANYHLQYKIYTIATMRWLEQILGNRFDPARDFGGVLYFYLRGMGEAGGSGVYFVPGKSLPDRKNLEEQLWRRQAS